MNEPGTEERAAILAVARHFSAPLDTAAGLPGAFVTIAGERIAVEATVIKERIAEGPFAKPRLRFDKVALRLIESLKAALAGVVVDGQTVIFTVTAPIRLPSKTAAALEDKIRACLERSDGGADIADTINGSQVRFCLVEGVAGASKVVGFVHNPETDPDILLRLTQIFLRHIGAAAGRGTPGTVANHRWLVVAHEEASSYLETYRQVYSQLSIRSDFERILWVSAGGRVDPLTG